MLLTVWNWMWYILQQSCQTGLLKFHKNMLGFMPALVELPSDLTVPAMQQLHGNIWLTHTLWNALQKWSSYWQTLVLCCSHGSEMLKDVESQEWMWFIINSWQQYEFQKHASPIVKICQNIEGICTLTMEASQIDLPPSMKSTAIEFCSTMATAKQHVLNDIICFVQVFGIDWFSCWWELCGNKWAWKGWWHWLECTGSLLSDNN